MAYWVTPRRETERPSQTQHLVSNQTPRLSYSTRHPSPDQLPSENPQTRRSAIPPDDVRRYPGSGRGHFVDPSLVAHLLGGSPSRFLNDVETLGFLFESLCIRDLRVYSQLLDGTVLHYRDENGLEVDAIIELRDGSWATFEIKLGGKAAIETAARSLNALVKKLSDEERQRMRSLNVLTAGTASYLRPDGVNVISLGHLRP